MTSRLTSFLRFLIPLLLAILLLYFAFQNIELKEFFAKISEVNFWWVIASILLSLISYIARAYRWNILLNPLGYYPNTYRTTLAVLVGYLANLAFPRLGEVTRCGMLKRTNDVPLSTSFGTVITERLLDAVTLLALIGLSFILEYERIITFLEGVFESYNIDFTNILIGLGVLAVIGLIIFIIFFVKENKYSARVRTFVRELYEGIVSIRRLRNLSGFLVSSVILWVTYYLMSYLIVFSLEETSFLDISAGFMLLVTGGIALTLPVQGGIGTYHTLVTAMLSLYGIAKTTGLFLATLLHTSQLLAIALFGGIALLLAAGISKRKRGSETNKDQNSDPDRSPASDQKVEA